MEVFMFQKKIGIGFVLVISVWYGQVEAGSSFAGECGLGCGICLRECFCALFKGCCDSHKEERVEKEGRGSKSELTDDKDLSTARFPIPPRGSVYTISQDSDSGQEIVSSSGSKSEFGEQTEKPETSHRRDNSLPIPPFSSRPTSPRPTSPWRKKSIVEMGEDEAEQSSRLSPRVHRPGIVPRISQVSSFPSAISSGPETISPRLDSSSQNIFVISPPPVSPSLIFVPTTITSPMGSVSLASTPVRRLSHSKSLPPSPLSPDTFLYHQSSTSEPQLNMFIFPNPLSPKVDVKESEDSVFEDN
jgi:hypothetical protein